jgi:hypothetical protein
MSKVARACHEHVARWPLGRGLTEDLRFMAMRYPVPRHGGSGTMHGRRGTMTKSLTRIRQTCATRDVTVV